MLNTKALSLATGITFALMALLQAIITFVVGANIVALPNVPDVAVDAGTAVAATIVGVIVAFIYGAILGAIGGGIYNSIARRDLLEMDTDDEATRGDYAYQS